MRLFAVRLSKPLLAIHRPFSTVTSRLASQPPAHENADEWRKSQKEKANNPHLTNTTSTIANQFPSIGVDKAPPELLSSVDSDFTPQDADPSNTDRMTGGTQQTAKPNDDLEVGEMEGADFKVKPLRRTGEDINTLRARLIYQSRKRGTLESDLLLSTFADANLARLSERQLKQYDHFLDENDWDIYYWATQEPTPTSREVAEGGSMDHATPTAQGTDLWRQGQARSGEWAQTVGAFKPAYRPVPQRWQNSEVLSMLRKHVKDRSAGGILEDLDTGVGGSGVVQGVKGGGLGRMPPVQNFDV